MRSDVLHRSVALDDSLCWEDSAGEVQQLVVKVQPPRTHLLLCFGVPGQMKKWSLCDPVDHNAFLFGGFLWIYATDMNRKMFGREGNPIRNAPGWNRTQSDTRST